MRNKEVADILDEIADYLEMQDVKWKPQAYRKAARNVENLSESVEELYEEEQLQDLDGVGENIAEKIIEYLETGKLEYLQELKQDIPVDIEALTAVEGLGPRKVKEIYEARKVTDLDELEEAAESGEIADIEGFGEKTEENILKHIEIARRGQDRMLLGKAYPIAEELRSGLEYILITDHGKPLDIADGIDEKALIKQAERIDELNEELEIEILKGIEANITGEGLDISRDKLKELDIVLASLHGRINSPTEKIIKVFRDYPVDIFAHPLNRKINSRKGLDIDLDKIIKVAAEEKVALEINSQPERLDLPWREIKEYREDVKFVVSTDAHSASELSYMHLGVAQARRGWCSKEEVLNTRPLEGLRSYFE